MIAQARARPDDTRARIIETAESLFRRRGCAPTSIEDIAAELRLSAGSVYRYFPSKDAIIETISEQRLAELEEKAMARARNSAVARMERLILQILSHGKESFLTEQRVHDIVLAAIERSTDTVDTHREIVRSIAELILRDGIEYHLMRSATVDAHG